MDDFEADHADLLKLDRLAWMRDTMEMLYDSEMQEPGCVDDFAVEALHASMHSWVTRILRLAVPA